MKAISKIFLSLCLIVGAGSAMTSYAQVESDATIRANIPYAFVVHNTTLPAGTYVVTVAETTDLKVLEIRSADNKLAVLFDTEPVNATRVARTSELVFDRVGDTYFLSQVFLSGDEGGNELTKSKRQERLEAGGNVSQKQSIPATRMEAKASKHASRKGN
ncbi:MAG TPA: hypothetical protein VFI24_14610 [Pyrinomonadaceae bacterium]|nr:hypothetical protein [Pyrinomonadaceae bacterium]